MIVSSPEHRRRWGGTSQAYVTLLGMMARKTGKKGFEVQPVKADNTASQSDVYFLMSDYLREESFIHFLTGSKQKEKHLFSVFFFLSCSSWGHSDESSLPNPGLTVNLIPMFSLMSSVGHKRETR